jgi:hypothetical protein
MVLLALALRPRQAPARLTPAREQATRAGSLERREVQPLSRVEAEELLGRSLQPHIATALYEESGGTPIYLEQLARADHRSRTVRPCLKRFWNRVRRPVANQRCRPP